jgi:AAA family ATP:ADP antiporter
LRPLVETFLPVRPSERRLTLVMCFHNLFAVGAFIAGRSARDALFLAHTPPRALPWMYVLSGLAVAVAGLAYAPLAARWRRDTLAAGSGVLFAGLFVASFWAARRGERWVYPALYVYVEVMGAIVLVQFWTLLNDLFHAREARRLYGPVGAGGMVSNIVVGLCTRAIARHAGATDVLLLAAGLSCGVAISAFLAGRVGRERLVARASAPAAPKAPSARVGANRVLRSGHLRMVALLAAVTFVTTTFVDFEFKVMAGRSLAQDQLAAYFGTFYATVGVLALGLQLFGTGQILNRLGVVSALIVLPLTLGGGNLGLALTGTLGAAALAKGADSLFRYTLNDATTQLLYLPVAPGARATAKAFIDGVVKSTAIALAGLALAFVGPRLQASMGLLAEVTLGLCVVWAGVVLAIRKGYIRSLQDTLRNRRLSESTTYPLRENAAKGLVLRALHSQSWEEILVALELLPQMADVSLDDRVEELLEHSVPAIRLAALTYFQSRQLPRHANAIFRRFEDAEAQVRAVAIETFCTLGKDKAIRTVRAYLNDPEPAVRSAAITGMIRFGGLDGVLAAAEALKGLISHEHSGMRLYAAKILGAIGVKNFYQPVLELMSDPEPSVRRQAIHSAGVLQSPEFVIPLIYKTPSKETGAEAIEALSSFGPSIAPTLGKVLTNALEEIDVRRSVARVLGRIGTPEAIEMLLPHLAEPDGELRSRIYRALARATRTRRLGSHDRRKVEAALELELARAFRSLSIMEALGLEAVRTKPPFPTKSPFATPGASWTAKRLLGTALNETVSRCEERIFLLLAVLHPEAGMAHIHQSLREPVDSLTQRRRANAVELLDNLLDRQLKRRLLPLVEDAPAKERLAAARELLRLPHPVAPEALADLCRDENPWIRACALLYAAESESAVAKEAVLTGVTDPDPVVRETALKCALKARPQEAAALAEKRREDESKAVRRMAESIAPWAPAA